MAETMIYTRSLTIQTCIECGIVFAMDKQVDLRFQETHETFYCPKGHKQYYSGKTESEILKQELRNAEISKNLLQQRNNSLHHELTEQKHKVRAEKAAKTRLKNRVKNGVCPCCNRTFQNLHNHMKTKHPEFSPSTSKA